MGFRGKKLTEKTAQVLWTVGVDSALVLVVCLG
jgi:hypothetical protein